MSATAYFRRLVRVTLKRTPRTQRRVGSVNNVRSKPMTNAAVPPSTTILFATPYPGCGVAVCPAKDRPPGLLQPTLARGLTIVLGRPGVDAPGFRG